VIAAAYAAEGIGESAGYLLGPGDSEMELARWELRVPRNGKTH